MKMKLSDKYQIVIPKEIRRKYDLKPGQELHVAEGKNGEIVIRTKPDIGKYYGIMKDSPLFGGEDAAKAIRKMRDEWDR